VQSSSLANVFVGMCHVACCSIFSKLLVPDIISSLSTKRVLTAEYAPGVSVDKVSTMDQESRNWV